MDAWYQLSLKVAVALSDAVSGLLFDLGSCGVQVEDAPHSECVCLKAYFPETQDRTRVTTGLRRGLSVLCEQGLPHAEGLNAIAICVDEVPQEDWSSGWRQHFKPVFPTPRIVVCPPWDQAPKPEGGCRIVIEPKMAFGTGSHETTRLALVAIDETLTAGDHVLDVGTGSGILSIAAVKLGAADAVGVDTDPLAVENARENVAQNGVAGRVEVLAGSASDVDGTFDLVAANIVSSILTPMLSTLRTRLNPQGRLVLCGVLAREEPAFVEAVGAAGLAVKTVLREGDWVCVVAGRT